MDCDIELINNQFNDTSLDTSSQKSSSSSKKSSDLDDRHHHQMRLVKNSSKLKQNVLIKDFELTTTQLKSLYFISVNIFFIYKFYNERLIQMDLIYLLNVSNLFLILIKSITKPIEAVKI